MKKFFWARGGGVDDGSLMGNARWAAGSGKNVTAPPLSIDGPHLSIRRFGHIPITEDDLLANETLTRAMLDVLKGAVAAPLHIIVSGATGAGKRTVLKVLAGYIGGQERTVTL